MQSLKNKLILLNAKKVCNLKKPRALLLNVLFLVSIISMGVLVVEELC